MSETKSITVSEAAAQFREGAKIVDVRTPAEYEGLHVEGSLLAPLDKLNAEELASQVGRGKPILVMCRSGKRAAMACKKLSEVLPDARAIEGGVEAWAAAGQPVKHGKGVMSLERQVRIAAGSLVLIGSLLAWKVSMGFIALPAFVGAGLIFAGLTDNCGMGMLLAKAPWNRRPATRPQKAALASS